MEGLLGFLLFVGLFYSMMRIGCSAHMMHGGHGGDDARAAGANHVDPVCGMVVDPNQGCGKMHRGRLYRFCSRNCLDKFAARGRVGCRTTTG
jgi:YHS domain-containing protein